jgi:outer membrane protein assembly factor BamE (lipoprotein component of BamABCDE complex)
MMRQIAKQRKAWIAISTIFVVLLFVIFAFWPRKQPFDPIGWQDQERIQKGVRLEMADRLIADHQLDGLTKTEVLKLLGEPPATSYFKDWDLVYWLGNERGFVSIDSEWLVIRFDANARVSEYRIVRD